MNEAVKTLITQLENLIPDLREGMYIGPYDNPEWAFGYDSGREHIADELEELIAVYKTSIKE